MHRIPIPVALCTALGIAVCIAGSPQAHADAHSEKKEAKLLDEPKAKRLSFQVSLGIKPDMANLGSTIARDGTIDTASTTIANALYSTTSALMGDRDTRTHWQNSQTTDSAFRLLGEEPKRGGPMLGLDLGLSVQYELDDVINLPLYVKAGLHYTTRVFGGSQDRTHGDVAAADPTVAGLLRANGENPDDFINGTMITQYDASWIELPITVGIKVPFKDEQSFVYGGLGVSYFRGGFSVEFDIDERYANALATHIDADAATVNNLSPGAVNDKLDLIAGAVGLNWQLGAQARVANNSVVYFELNASGTAKTVYSSEMKPETQQLLTALSSENLAEQDPRWFKRLAYPVVTSGAVMRVGFRYYFF